MLFEGEQHGFRRSANIRRALDSELQFYGSVFGFEPPMPADHEDLQMGGIIIQAPSRHSLASFCMF